MDEAKRKGLEVDTRSLARDLGIPAIPISARTGMAFHSFAFNGWRSDRRHPSQPSLFKCLERLSFNVR